MRTGKILWLTIVLMLALSVLPAGKTQAQNLPRLFVNPQNTIDPTLIAGEGVFVVSIDVENAVDLSAHGFRLWFDPTIVNALDASEGPFLLTDAPEGTTYVANVQNEGGYMDVGDARNGVHPGVDGNGTLVIVTFLVLGTGETLLDLDLTVMLNHYLNPITHTVTDGYFSNLPADTFLADLTGKSAWPQFHHFGITAKAPNTINKLFGKVVNEGTQATMVKVVFTVIKGGNIVGTLESAETSIAVGETLPEVSADFDTASWGTGKYYIYAQAWYKYGVDGYIAGAKVKGFGFAVVP